jgi:hypothetical protein
MGEINEKRERVWLRGGGLISGGGGFGSEFSRFFRGISRASRSKMSMPIPHLAGGLVFLLDDGVMAHKFN